MSTPHFGTCYWRHRTPIGRRPRFPRHRGELDVDVAIIGGDLPGCAIAYTFATAGVKVAVFGAAEIGSGATASGAGLLQGSSTELQHLIRLHGLRSARRLWQGLRRAALDGAAVLRRLRVPCQLEPRDDLYFTTNVEEAARLGKEYRAQREARIDASFLNAGRLLREARIAGVAGIKHHGHAHLDPHRACRGLAVAALTRDALIFERSPIMRLRTGRKFVEVRTAGGTVRARTVVIATGLPPSQLKPLARHFDALDTYMVMTSPLAPAIRRAIGGHELMFRDTAQPPHTLRWVGGDRVLIGGGDQAQVPARRRSKVLIQRAGQLMYELSLVFPAISGTPAEYAWDTSYGRTLDGLPCIGRHRNYPRHLFALGCDPHDAAGAFLAARLLVREYLGEPQRADDIFGFNRILR